MTMSDSTNGDAKAAKAGKATRGAGYPSLALPDAVALIKTMGQHGKVHTREAVATYAGHTTANSGPFRSKLAALRDFGLIVASSDEVTITELAMRIAHPLSTEDERNALVEAFDRCVLFKKIWNASAKGVALQLGGVANSAVNNYGVAVGTKQQFAESFSRSVVAVGLGEIPKAGEIILRAPIPSESETTDPDIAEDGTARSESAAQPGNQAPKTRIPAEAPIVLVQEWPTGDGAITFAVRSRSPLEATTFGLVGTVIQSIEALAKALGPAGDEE